MVKIGFMTLIMDSPQTKPPTHKRKKHTKNKIETSYTLTPEAIEKLSILAQTDGISSSSELEIMIRDRYNRRKHKLEKERERDSEQE